MNQNDPQQEFVKLLTEHQARLAVFVRALIPNASAAKDVLQETNLTLWSKRDDFSIGSNFWAWASRVAFFEVRAYRSRVARDKCVFNDELVQQLAALAESHNEFADARHAALRTCLEKLPSASRDLVRARYYSGASLQALAAQVSRTVDATRKVLQRARKSLLACIEKALARGGDA